MSDELGQQVKALAAENAELRKQVMGLAEIIRQQRFALDSIPVRVFWKDREAQYLGGNALLAQDLGLARVGDLTGHSDFELFPPEQAAIYREQDNRIIKGQVEAITQVDEIELAEGNTIWRETSLVPLRDTAGRIIGVLGVYADITERRLDEDRLRESERQLAEAKRIAGLGRWVADARQQTLSWDARMYALFGLEPGMPVDNARFFSLIHPEDHDRVYQHFIDLVQGRIDDYVLEYRVARPDGTVGYLNTRGAVERDADGSLVRVIGVAQDVTDLREAEAERLRLQQAIINAQQQALKDLSTPIIPIMDRMIIMPLIGNLDADRAQDIMRALLAGISQYRAKVVILDITGVPVVDTHIASYLDRTIAAARLKGATTIITGISDAVAETLVDLGITWHQVTIRRDLQSGLRYGLQHLGIELKDMG